MFGNEELRPFLVTPKLTLTFIQTIDIALKQLYEKKRNIGHKINILAEKSTSRMVFYAFLNHFSTPCI